MLKMNQEKIDEKIKEPTISACMIVKNEEKFLAQCLDSIKDVVDEIIVVDTGSTDSTMEIAKRYTDKVYFHEWQNSFSEARNYSIQFAQCDWILQIDADEKFEQKDAHLLKAVLKDKRFDSIHVALLSDLPTGISKHYFQRVFRRGKGNYEGIVHNQLVCKGNSVFTEIRFYHYGYNLDPEQMQKKFKRTEALLKKQVEDNPDYMFSWMNLVRIYKCQELWDDAIKTAEEVINTKREILDDTTYQMIAYDMAYSIFSKKEYNRAEKVCSDILKSYPDNLDVSFLSGSISICKKIYQKAIRDYMRYLRISEENTDSTGFSNLIVDTYASQGQAWNNIGSAYAELFHPDKSIEAYRKAISYKNDPVYYENLARVLFRQNRIDEMMEILEKADSLEIANNAMLAQLAEVYGKQGKINEAIGYLRRITEKDKTNVYYQVKLAGLLTLNDDLNKAQAILQRMLDSGIKSPEILHNLAMVSMKLQEKTKVEEYMDKLAQMDDINSEQYLSMGDDWVNMREHEIAINFYEKCLQSDQGNPSALINLSTCYAELGQYESAIVGYRAALVQNPNDSTVIGNLLAMKKIIEAQHANL